MMNEQKIILVDQDGVLSDLQKYFLHIIEKRYPDIFATYSGTLSSYDMEKEFAPQFAETIKALRLERGFFANLPIIAGAKEGLSDLVTSGHDVRICTAPTWEHEFCVPEKLAWIDEHLGREFTGRTIITRDKTLILGDILIDDKPEVSGIRKPTWEHIIYDQPYNRAGDKKRLTWKNYREVLGL